MIEGDRKMKGRKSGTEIDAAVQRYLLEDYRQRNVPKGIERTRLTIAELEKRTGLTRKTIAYQLKGEGVAITLRFICKYAQAVGSTPDSFIRKMVQTLKNQNEI